MNSLALYSNNCGKQAFAVSPRAGLTDFLSGREKLKRGMMTTPLFSNEFAG
jgi:hypothetical protein